MQICPNGKGVIFVTLKSDVAVDDFICHDLIEVNESGIRVVNIKAAGKREIVVHLKGLHPNTKDQGVLDYLAKFGKISTTRVIHSTFGDGPLKGVKNGDRSYKLEIKPGIKHSLLPCSLWSKGSIEIWGSEANLSKMLSTIS